MRLFRFIDSVLALIGAALIIYLLAGCDLIGAHDNTLKPDAPVAYAGDLAMSGSDAPYDEVRVFIPMFYRLARDQRAVVFLCIDGRYSVVAWCQFNAGTMTVDHTYDYLTTAPHLAVLAALGTPTVYALSGEQLTLTIPCVARDGTGRTWELTGTLDLFVTE